MEIDIPLTVIEHTCIKLQNGIYGASDDKVKAFTSTIYCVYAWQIAA